MSQNKVEPMSAFAIYTAKRKSVEQASNSKKTKQEHLLQKGVASNQNPAAEKAVKQTTKKRRVKRKHASNAIPNMTDVVAKKRILKIRKRRQKTVKLNLNKRVSFLKHVGKKQSNYNTINCESDNEIEGNGFNEDPINDCTRVFEWLIYPMKPKDFFSQKWEKRTLHLKRCKSSYYSCLVSTPLLDEVLRENNVLFTKNIDITSYTNGMRETHNPPGRAHPSIVWDYYLNDCSVRMLNPQTFISKIYALNATLQEFFGCFVGSNLYLTPPNSQGFAPHYDDIEAFVLQVEGKKRWRLYKSPEKSGYLARYSSRNFDQSEIGEPILDTVIEAGDLLYFPRGTVHQAETIEDTHSLHITLSVYQKNSWCDFFEKLLPQTLKRAAENDNSFRAGLPLDYLRYFGTAHTTSNEDARSAFKARIKVLFNRLIDYIDVDNAADLMAKGHIHDFLPPCLTWNEKERSVAEDGDTMTSNGIVTNRVEIKNDTKIRLIRSHCIRLMEEDGTYKIYFSTENSKEYHEYEPQFLEIDEEFIPAIRKIILHYPEFIYVKDLPIDDDDNKIQLVKDLWEKGLVLTYTPLCAIAKTKRKPNA